MELELEHREQPPNIGVCGQCSVAVLAQVSIADVCRVIAHERGTRTIELVYALKMFGIRTSERLKPHSGDPPETCILKIPDRRGGKILNRNWHWIAHHAGWYHDPNLPHAICHYPIRFSSYLLVNTEDVEMRAVSLLEGEEWGIEEPSGTIIESTRSKFLSLSWMQVIGLSKLWSDQLRKLGYRERKVPIIQGE